MDVIVTKCKTVKKDCEKSILQNSIYSIVQKSSGLSSLTYRFIYSYKECITTIIIE